MEYPGPLCRERDLTKANLLDSEHIIHIGQLSNGIVLELKTFLEKSNGGILQLVRLIQKLDSEFVGANEKSVCSKIIRLCDIKKKLSSKKKVPGYKNIADLLTRQFVPPVAVESSSSSSIDVHELVIPVLIEETPVPSCCSPVSVSVQTDFDDDLVELKSHNLLQYNYNKLIKKYNKVDLELKNKTERAVSLGKRLGHYSVRNVNKREAIAKQKLKSVSNLKCLVRKQKSLLKEAGSKITTLNDLKKENESLKEADTSVHLQFKKEKAKKITLQKTVSYLRKELLKYRPDKSINANHAKELKAQSCQIETLCSEIFDLQGQCVPNIKTKKSDGTYANNIRLCVVELSALEVAVEKVSPVIQVVCKHVANYELKKSELPNSTTVQSIVDEGHFLAKTFISEKLDNAEHWGLNRDGTTRRKQKILDTSVTLSSGDIISLGFNRVAHETAVTINSVTKEHLTELATLNSNSLLNGDDSSEQKCQEYITRSLEKLAFTMSDRASNEKLANTLLSNWRNEMLVDFDGDNRIVHNFHCMAHVLLGFHSYTTPLIKELESKVVEAHGPIGRDALPVFKFWSKKGTAVERTLRTTSEVFGPAGDHHGVRDRWDAYCSANGIKSVIGNYRDNRFNALFQTAAEVYLHLEDFLHVLQTVKTPNLKLKAVKADLESPFVKILLQCLGLFYVKFTGPYWNLVTCGKISYLELYPVIGEIKAFLETCLEDPMAILEITGHWSASDPLELLDVQHRQRYLKSLFVVDVENQDILFDSIKCVSTAMIKVIEKQLVDFLPGGQFCNDFSIDELNRTKFAQVTNLGCEHHFGDLDSSQRRRPSASMHHHSSVQLLKRNRSSMMQWLADMPEPKQQRLLKSARKGGKKLREIHMRNEKRVVADIHTEMTTEKESKRRKTKKKHEEQGQSKNNRQEDSSESDGEHHIIDAEMELRQSLPIDVMFDENKYVAVAYQDRWYPGLVESLQENNNATVKFMAPCKKPGTFQWPSRDDRQLVNTKFVLQKGFIPDCISSGRQWFIPSYKQIQTLFDLFSCVYFK